MPLFDQVTRAVAVANAFERAGLERIGKHEVYSAVYEGHNSQLQRFPAVAADLEEHKMEIAPKVPRLCALYGVQLPSRAPSVASSEDEDITADLEHATADGGEQNRVPNASDAAEDTADHQDGEDPGHDQDKDAPDSPPQGDITTVHQDTRSQRPVRATRRT